VGGRARAPFFAQPFSQVAELVKPQSPGARIKVQVHNRNAAPAHIQFRKQKPLFPDLPAPENHGF